MPSQNGTERRDTPAAPVSRRRGVGWREVVGFRMEKRSTNPAVLSSGGPDVPQFEGVLVIKPDSAAFARSSRA